MIEKGQMMLNDIVWDNNGHTARIIALTEDEFLVKADGDEYDGENTCPMPLNMNWILIEKAKEICKKHGIILDFSRKRKLKLSLICTDSNGNEKIQISFFYPMPQYVHELQHIIRNFDLIEI